MAYVIERPVINDVQAPRWMGYASGMSHAFLAPAGKPLEGPTSRTACKRVMDVARLTGDSAKRCKTCVAFFADVKVKANAGLSERTTDVVHTGAQQGAPRDAEKRVAAQVEAIGKGEAPVPHGESARAVKGQSPAMDPGLSGKRGDTGRRVAGQRGEARMDGVAMVPGGVNVPPVQPMWRNPKTKQLEVSSRGTMAGGMGQDRPDRSIVGGRDKGRFSKSQRRNWQRKENAKARWAALAALEERVSRLES